MPQVRDLGAAPDAGGQGCVFRYLKKDLYTLKRPSKETCKRELKKRGIFPRVNFFFELKKKRKFSPGKNIRHVHINRHVSIQQSFVV